jgi:hypothetical protein
MRKKNLEWASDAFKKDGIKNEIPIREEKGLQLTD